MTASVTAGVMKPLIGKLTKLLGEEYKKLTGVRKQASFLGDELSAMKALLDKMEFMDKLDPSAKNWRDHVREMSYDMENCIDDFMHEIEGADAKTGFVKKMAKRLRRLGRRHQIANRIEELKVLAVEANARRERYKIDDCVDSSPGFVAVDPRMSAIYKEAAGLVGIDGPRKELVSLLMDSEKKRKVVSIVGFGGLGKTTLAKQVYDEIGGQFECTSFVSVSQRPDVKGLLIGLQRKLGREESSHGHDLQDIIDCLRKKPQTSEFQEVSAQILKKCGGLPLAIITIASLLASHEARSLNEWESIKNSLGAKFAKRPTLEEMMGILNLSYTHLPVHLRPCFLYLGMCPEDSEIMRNDLVRQWITEGFVCSSHGDDLEDVAKSYFNELINRNLIQPERTEYGEVLSCRVHDMLLDLILGKSTEDNFISVAYNYEDLARLQSCEYKVRRLSLKSSAGGATLETLATSMSQVRSYAQFGESKYTPPLSQFKYLRVLLFEFPDVGMIVDLGAIGHLFLLRYVKVLAKSAEVVLPTEIQRLMHLETLELKCNPAQRFPSDITRLANLFHLILPDGTVLPEGIQNMKSVRILHCSGMSESSLEDIKGLSELNNLKELKLSAPYVERLTVGRVDALVSSIGMLRDLKHLTLNCESECDDCDRQLDSLPDPPPRLEVLDLKTWTFSRVPKWICELRCLRILKLRVLHLSSDEVCVLGELPSLVSAWFRMLDVSQDKIMVGTGLFPVLEDVLFWSYEDVTPYLSFEAGAMPKLQWLTLQFRWTEWRGSTPVGMECLPCLQDICVWLHPGLPEPSKNWEDVYFDVVASFKSAARVHPRHPTISVI